MATCRPKRSISRPNYSELCDVHLPRERKARKKQVNVQRKDPGKDSTFYRCSVPYAYGLVPYMYTYMGCPYAYGVPIHVWAARTRMGWSS